MRIIQIAEARFVGLNMWRWVVLATDGTDIRLWGDDQRHHVPELAPGMLIAVEKIDPNSIHPWYRYIPL